MIQKREFHYTGELDHMGKACGIGKAERVDEPNETFEGSFMNDEPHGFCKNSLTNNLCVELI